MNHLKALPPLTAEAEATLIRAAQAGDQEALDTLVRSQLRYLRKEAGRRSRANAAEADDLVQEGLLALMAAIGRHDPARGRLWTAAKRDIAKAMAGATSAANSPVTVPTTTMQFWWKAARETTSPEDAKAWATSPERGTMRMDPDTYDAIGRLAHRVPFGQGEDGVSRSVRPGVRRAEAGVQADPNATPRLSSIEDRDEAQGLLAVLPERERRVMEMAMGFFGEPMTDGAIAKELGVDRSRVVRIRQAAVARMRDEVAQ